MIARSWHTARRELFERGERGYPSLDGIRAVAVLLILAFHCGSFVAMLGGEIQVPTLRGKLALRIPPETQNGRVFRLAGQGMPHLGDATRGDMLARVNVILPTRLTTEEKDLFRRLAELRPG